MAQELNQNMWPSGGYFFIDADGVKHKASGWEALIKRVTEYRARAGQPAGDPRAEIIAQACGRNPGLCRDSEPKRPGPVNPKKPVKERVLSWMTMLLQEKRLKRLKLVPRDEAARRAAICAACPMHRPFPRTCGQCRDSVLSAQEVILDGKAPVNAGVECCTAGEVYAGTLVHLDLPSVPVTNMPENCWLKKL